MFLNIVGIHQYGAYNLSCFTHLLSNLFSSACRRCRFGYSLLASGGGFRDDRLGLRHAFDSYEFGFEDWIPQG